MPLHRSANARSSSPHTPDDQGSPPDGSNASAARRPKGGTRMELRSVTRSVSTLPRPPSAVAGIWTL